MHLRVFYTDPSLYIGTVAQFSCEEGFQIEGTRSSTCLTDGKWSYPKPKCRGIFFIILRLIFKIRKINLSLANLNLIKF